MIWLGNYLRENVVFLLDQLLILAHCEAARGERGWWRKEQAPWTEIATVSGVFRGIMLSKKSVFPYKTFLNDSLRTKILHTPQTDGCPCTNTVMPEGASRFCETKELFVGIMSLGMN